MAKPTAADSLTTRFLPQRSEFLIRWFGWYVQRYQLAKHFHAVRLSKAGPVPTVPLDLPLIVVLNHASWWDPLIGWPLLKFFPNRVSYAPMDAAMLKKYAIFQKLGCYGVEAGTSRGAVLFLKLSEAILKQPGAMIWLTAQGEFVDPRRRPVELRRGIGHLLHRLPRAGVLPLAIEYTFWTEKTPEALLHFGPLIETAGSTKSPDDWTATITTALESAQDDLATAGMSRDPSRFTTLVGGTAGVGGMYDLGRRFMAMVRGTKFNPAHQTEGTERTGEPGTENRE